MKKLAIFAAALMLTLGLAQCKKEQPSTTESEPKTIHITVNVGGSSKHVVDPSLGTVNYSDDDVLYVGDGSHYIGTLTCASGAFSGDIIEPTGENPQLHLYFVGGPEREDLTPGSTTSFNVDISDQSSGELPVLSYTSVAYETDKTAYECELKNKCALVKYTFTNEIRPVRVGGRYTQATINFGSTPGIVPNTETTGFITLKSVSATEKYGIFLPQDAVEGAEMIMGYDGYTLNVPAIGHNDYTTINGDAAVTNNIVYLNYLTGNYTATNGKILTGTLNGETQPYKINVNTDGATVTLHDATINGKNDKTNCSWAGITCENNTTLVIEGTNNVTGFYEDYPGIHIASGKTLTIQGTGTLNASSNGGANGWGAGIGGSDLVDCGNIVINSGTINATGGKYMAGIGGGYGKNCGSITINGGNVTATGGRGAAGIGTGLTPENNITGGDISITGGTVVATGGKGAAGIGSGFVTYYGIHNTCGNISITGGQVTATGGDGGNVYPDILNYSSWEGYIYYGGAGIGTGSTANYYEGGSSSCGTITIGSGVTRVTATKGGGTHPATNSIGKNESTINPGTCGTVTIGGTKYWENNDYVGTGSTYLTQSTLTYQP